MSLHDAALRAGIYSYIQKRAGELLAQAKTELRVGLPFGDTVAGRTDGRIIAKASWTRGRQTVVVEDAAALLDWVKRDHPTEVVESVNPAYLSTFKAVGGVVIDGNGEPVPGMGVKFGEPYLTVKGNDETGELVGELLKSGVAGINVIKALEGGEE
jgi:hypothetical protein